MDATTKQRLRRIPPILFFAYLFFLSIDFMGRGMKESFKEPLKHFLHDNAASFTELASFVVGILGTSLVQSSSTVTSLAVTLTQDGIVPLVIAVGIVHGANLGTSVTSSIVAFASELKPSTGNFARDAIAAIFEPRRPGFQRAVSTAVVHGFFNIILVTAILLLLELPFGAILRLSELVASVLSDMTTASDGVLEVLEIVSPKTWTAPVSKGLLGLGLPGWGLVLAGFPLLFWSLKGFAGTMREVVLADVEETDMEAIGRKMLGTNSVDTFVRGLVLTILVQSSSATTSMVVPLAGMGLFSVRQVLPFIMGANIGTTTTALIAATAALGEPGFHAGMTIALAHFFLNTLAVVLVAAVPGLSDSVVGAAEWMGEKAALFPGALLGYLATLTVVVPLVVYFLPQLVAALFIGGLALWMLVGPHIYLRRKAAITGIA